MTYLDYIILFEENIDEAVKLTGKSKEVLEAFLRDTKSYGHHIVLWKEFNTWFAIRIDKEFVNDGVLDELIQTILRRPH